MTRRMLIDGTHPEEARVVITSSNRLDEYDVETSTKKQFKGNIYLAKVTRVEPSLQAAFVDFGGDRHGFLAFNDIHPDYFQIPVEDREALIAATLARAGDSAQELLDEFDGAVDEQDRNEDEETADKPAAEADEGGEGAETGVDEGETAQEAAGSPADAAVEPRAEDAETGAGGPSEPEDEADDSGDDSESRPRSRKSSDGAAPRSVRQRPRRYKIQEVVKRRQIILVQIVKDERSNKGAALTTYISLAGRYCVLMPNTARGGGISRRITGTTTRRKLKSILDGLDIQDGMGVIIRTAGMDRSKAEIGRDCAYLLRVWDGIRDRVMEAIAPTMIHEDASLVKRAIRDLYTKEVEEVLVEGAETYQQAKKFMRLMMPSHAKRVQPYRDDAIPLFYRYQVEDQLDAMHRPDVPLKLGGSIVIHSTEALVAIDVNSGKSTRERNIRDTALKTNLEAAEEVARQLRLRDLAGLVVIDFIDMEEARHLRQVERRLKEAMKPDRARIQIGRISEFGLLELSRQRLRSSLEESSSDVCRHCRGAGVIRSTESLALRLLRTLEEEGMRRRSSEVSIAVPTEVALYVLNNKRATLNDMETRYGFRVAVVGDDTVVPPDMRIERAKETPNGADGDDPPEPVPTPDDGERKRPRRRRTRRKPARDAAAAESVPEAAEGGDGGDAKDAKDAKEDAPKRRRRGRRGGRGRASHSGSEAPAQRPEDDAPETVHAAAEPAEAGAAADVSPETPAPADDAGDAAPSVVSAEAPVPVESRTAEGALYDAEPAPEGSEAPKRRGWWRRPAD